MCLSYVCLFLVSLLAICHGQCPFSETSLRIANGYISNAANIHITTTNLGTNIAYGYLEYACAPDYTLNPTIGNRLTCNSNGSWSPLPNCVMNSGGVPVTTTTTTMRPTASLPCPVDSMSFSLENGFLLNNSYPLLPLVPTFSGWVLFSCGPGYILDSTIGGLYSCNNGVWSTKPRCLRTGNCSLSTLSTLLSTTTGLQSTGQTQLIPMPYAPTLVLNGSYAVFICMSGYTNIGGSLNVTCNANSAWSPLPNCVMNSGGVPVTTTTTTMRPTASLPCPVDSTSFSLENGFLLNNSYPLLPLVPIFSGWFLFSCGPGYILDSAIGGLYSCNNGVWSTKPRCLRTGNCSLSTLSTLLSTTTGLQSTGQTQLIPMPYAPTLVLNGSYAVFICMSGYTNIGGSLNVTCNANGGWSPFPNCVLGAQMTTVPPTDGSACAYSSSILTIPNGYASNLNGLMLSTANQAASGSFIDYLCISPYTLSGNSRMTCANGAWSPQPMCMAPTQVSTATTLSPLQCVGIPSVPNAYISNAIMINFGNNNYEGQVHFTCNPGYRHVNTSGARWVACTNGVWSTLPVCAVTPVCSVSELQSALVNIGIVSNSLSAGANGGVLAGGWIQLQCAPGFNLNPISGSLNVTCQATGRWTQFPICS